MSPKFHKRGNAEQRPDEGGATARLRDLRRTMTLLIAALAAIATIVFAFVVLRTDRQLADEQIDAELLRLVSATASAVSVTGDDLVIDDNGLPDGIVAAGVRPFVNLFEIEEGIELQDDFFALSDDDLAERYGAAFDGLESPQQYELLSYATGVFEDDDGEGDPSDEDVAEVESQIDSGEAFEQMLEEVPGSLVSDASRTFLAEELGQEASLVFAPVDVILDRTPIDTDRIAQLVAVALDTSDLDGEIDGFLARAAPIRDGFEVRGAAVAFVDPEPFDQRHADLRNRVIALAAALVAASMLGAWFIAGRSISPAADALAQQERFLADAAHELRTPVAAIRATAEHGLSGGEATEALERVTIIAQRASTLTDDLLFLARVDAGEASPRMEPVRLDLLVEQITDEDTDVELLAQPTTVLADPGLLGQAIDNLIRNARAHGGASAQQPARVTVADGCVVVSDSGPGIDGDVAAAMFDRFASGPSSPGHGLGLPLALWITEAHGGTLTAAAAPDGGAIFTLRVPTQLA